MTIPQDEFIVDHVNKYLDGTIQTKSLLHEGDIQHMNHKTKQIYDKLIKDKTISLRVSSSTLDQVKKIASQQGIPYQTLIGSWIHQHTTSHNLV